MLVNYLKLLACPKCHSSLRRVANQLECRREKVRYVIRSGIPILVNLSNLPSHLRSQIDYFEKESILKEVDHVLFAWQKSYLDRFLENFPSVKDKIIVDCGAGSGYMAIELAKRGAKVIACDLTLSGLVRLKKIAKKLKIEENLYLACCSAEDLPFKSQIVDYFITNAVLEHLPRENEAIQEIDRVCKKNAGLFITVPLLLKYILPIFWVVNILHDKRIGHLRRYDKEQLVSKFRRWKIKRTYYTGHIMKVILILSNILYPLFSENFIEKVDNKETDRLYGSSNISGIFTRKLK